MRVRVTVRVRVRVRMKESSHGTDCTFGAKVFFFLSG